MKNIRDLGTSRVVSRGLIAATVVAIGLTVGGSASAARPFDTATMQYPLTAFEGPQANAGFTRLRGAGATFVKLNLEWRHVAPHRRPARPADPSDPAYDWSGFDAKLRLAVRHGLRPIVMVLHAPAWASGANGWDKPDVAEFALFARAAATRYSGVYRPTTPDFPYFEDVLPRVRYWQVWNEPNLLLYLTPQYAGGRLVSAGLYRTMVNRFSAAVKAVNATNLVLAGGTGPFKVQLNSAPLAFMREFLCLRANLTPKPNCGPVRFDIWGHHPYTSGGPTRSALAANDVSLGDLPKMRQVLRAAAARGKISSRGAVRFWVDEFSWDTSPPDPGGVPMRVHARWVAEGMYRMWKAGVTLVAWLQLMDNRWTGVCGDPYQAGLYFWSPSITTAKPKRSLGAFRFPFVALRQNKGIYVWGRTPGSKAGKVVVQRKTKAGWRNVGTLRAPGNGVFQRRYAKPWRNGELRARVGGTTSVPFSLTPVKNRFFNPFGQRPAPGQCS